MSKLLLRFVTTSDPVSCLIRLHTDCPFSHVEFVLDHEWDSALESRNLPHEGTLGAHLSGGVRIRPLDYDRFSRVELASVECTPEQKAAVIESALGCVGDEYDVRNIAGILFHQDWAEKGHYICSVFVAEKLINSGVHILRVTDKLPSITPRDVYMSPLLETVQF